MLEPDKGKKCRLGFNHMSDGQRKLCVDDAIRSIGYVIRDQYHNTLTQEEAEKMAEIALLNGLEQLEMLAEQAPRLIQVLGLIVKK